MTAPGIAFVLNAIQGVRHGKSEVPVSVGHCGIMGHRLGVVVFQVLFHCQAGVNRSAALALAAWCIREQGSLLQVAQEACPGGNHLQVQLAAGLGSNYYFHQARVNRRGHPFGAHLEVFFPQMYNLHKSWTCPNFLHFPQHWPCVVPRLHRRPGMLQNRSFRQQLIQCVQREGSLGSTEDVETWQSAMDRYQLQVGWVWSGCQR